VARRFTIKIPHTALHKKYDIGMKSVAKIEKKIQIAKRESRKNEKNQKK